MIPPVLNHRSQTLIRLLAATAALIVAAGITAGHAGAATYAVSKTADTNDGTCDVDCSLREAVVAANASLGADVVNFASSLAVELDSPLPTVTETLSLNAGSSGATVHGTAGYAATYCAGSSYALDLSDSGAVGSTVLKLPIYAVCNRAIKSAVVAPSFSVGPRRYDGTLPISGSSPGGETVDFFAADGPTTGTKEADDYTTTVTAVAGVFSFTLGTEPTPGQKLTATSSGASGTSNFATAVTVPDDVTSPVLTAAVAVGNSRVRLDFSEPVSPASVVPAEFKLSMGNLDRPITAAAASGNSVFLDTNLPWNTGEAGNMTTTGTGRVTDISGNELIGLPATTVFAGPGELDAPVIGSMRFSSNRFCQRVTAKCKRGKTLILISLNKPARVIFNIYRGTVRGKQMVTFVKRLDAGRNRVKFTATVSGRLLPATGMTLRATAYDVARTPSAPLETIFRVVTSKRDL